MLIWSFVALALVASIIYVRIAGFVIWKAALLFAACFLTLNLLYLLVLGLGAIFIGNTKPISKQNAFCRAGCVGVSTLITGYCMVRSHVSGLEKLPRDQRFLLVCNHMSMFDPLVVLDKLRDFNVAFISKVSNMKIPIAGRLAYGAGFLPIDRDNDRKALRSILTAVDYLKRDLCSIGVYPEGTRSKTGELLPFHPGSFKIAQKAEVAVVVASVRNTDKVAKNILRGGTDVYLDIVGVIPAERVKEMTTAELADHSRELIQASLAAAC